MSIFKRNLIFRTLQKSVQDKPVYMVILIKLMMVPSLFKQSTLGILDVPFKLFLATHVLVDSIFSCVFINFGKQMLDLNELFGITSTQFDFHINLKNHHFNSITFFNYLAFSRSLILISAFALVLYYYYSIVIYYTLS